MNPQLLGCHFGSGNAVGDLLKRDIPGIVWSTMVGLHIDAEWREATIVGGAKALFVDVFGRGNQLIANLLRRFRTRTLRDDDANLRHLREPICVFSQIFAHQFVGGFAIAFTGHLQLKITGIELEQLLQ